MNNRIEYTQESFGTSTKHTANSMAPARWDDWEIAVLALLILTMINFVLCDFNRINIIQAGVGLLGSVAGAVVFTNLTISQRSMNLRLTCMLVTAAIAHAIFVSIVMTSNAVVPQARPTQEAQMTKESNRAPAAVAQHARRKSRR